MTKDAERTARVKARIEKSQERLRSGTASSFEKVADATRPARDAAADFAHKHPVAAIAGGIALGFVAGRLLPRAFGGKMAKTALTAATLASELGLAYGARAGASAAAAGTSAANAGRAGLAAARRSSAVAGTRLRGTGLMLAGEAIKLAARARR